MVALCGMNVGIGALSCRKAAGKQRRDVTKGKKKEKTKKKNKKKKKAIKWFQEKT